MAKSLLAYTAWRHLSTDCLVRPVSSAFALEGRRETLTHSDDDPLPAAVHLHPTHAPAVLALGVTHVHHSLLHQTQSLILVFLSVELADLAGAERLVQRGVEDRDDAREPRGDIGDEGQLEWCRGRGQGGQVEGRFALVDVVGEGVGADTRPEVFGALRVLSTTGSHA